MWGTTAPYASVLTKSSPPTEGIVRGYHHLVCSIGSPIGMPLCKNFSLLQILREVVQQVMTRSECIDWKLVTAVWLSTSVGMGEHVKVLVG